MDVSVTRAFTTKAQKERALPQRKEFGAKANDSDCAAQQVCVNPRSLICILNPEIERLRVLHTLVLITFLVAVRLAVPILSTIAALLNPVLCLLTPLVHRIRFVVNEGGVS